jgi:signal transduction histidine kinase
MKSGSDKLYTRGGFWAFLAIVFACYVQVFIYLRGPWLTWSHTGFVALGLLYLWVGTDRLFWAAQKGNLAGRLAYVGAMVLLATSILFASPMPGMIGLIALPVVGQAVFLLPRRFVGLFTLLLYLITLAHLAAPYGWTVALNNSLSFLAAFVFTLVFSYTAQAADRAREEAEALSARLEEANRKLREAAAQTEELAVARERNRLAREIHDGLGHFLTTIAVQLEAAQALLGDSPSLAADAIDKASKLSQEALADVRRSVGALRVDTARSPLVHQLEQLAQADPQLMVAVSVRGTARDQASAVEHAFFRVAQEGLTNVRKHAGTGRAQLTLDFRDPTLVKLSVEDDGRGAFGEAVAGFGLNGVRERIELLGGTMAAAGRPEGGFALLVEIPG